MILPVHVFFVKSYNQFFQPPIRPLNFLFVISMETYVALVDECVVKLTFSKESQKPLELFVLDCVVSQGSVLGPTQMY